MVQSISDYFNNEKNVIIIKRCIDAGVKFQKQQIIKESTLSGKKFVVTGSLVQFNRSEIKQKIELHDAQLSSSISKKTDFLIIGENPGSKFEKAKKMNIKIINEKQFLKMLEKT